MATEATEVELSAEADRVARLKRMLHSLATRIPRIILQPAEEIFPALKLYTDYVRPAPEIKNTIEDFKIEKDEADMWTSDHIQQEVQQDGISELVSSLHQDRREEKCLVQTDKSCSCVVCVARLSNKSELEKLSITQKEKCPIKPDVCSNSYVSQSELKLHCEFNSVRRSYKCTVCNSDFNSPKYLRKHFLTLSNKPPFQYHVCGKKFAGKECLKKHFASHGQFKCDICNKQYKLYSRLKEHMRIHTGEQLYKCLVCNKMFNQRMHLATHIRIHTGDEAHSERKFKCDICNKQYKLHCRLKEHIRIHTGAQPYRCHVCNKMFNLGMHLTTHIRRHTEAAI